MHLNLGPSASHLCVELTCALKHLLTEGCEPRIQWQERNYLRFIQDERFALSGELLSDCCLLPAPYMLKNPGWHFCHWENYTPDLVMLECIWVYCWGFLMMRYLLQISLNQKKNSSIIYLRSKIILAPFSSATRYPHVSKRMISYSPGISTLATGVYQPFRWSVPRSK